MVSVILPAEVWELYFDCPLNVSSVAVTVYIFLKFCLFCLKEKNILLNFSSLTS